MKICFIASANSLHIVKWSRWFVSRGHQIDVISFEEDQGINPYARIYEIPIGFDVHTASYWKKISYLTHSFTIKKLVQQIHPDIINVHYASSYGSVAALSGIGKYILSLWGSDIYDFPNVSFFHRELLKYSLRKAGLLLSTSHAMAEEARKYTTAPITITPFGVDMDLFKPCEHKNVETFTVGTIKTLEPIYGIEYLIRAVAILKKEHPEIPLRLRIAGKGAYENAYKELASELGIENITTWLGFISQDEAAKEWASFDVSVIVSEAESFGVSAVESQACGTPVIVSDIPGLKESTFPGVSSIVVPKRDCRTLADAILSLYRNEKLRRQMGCAGRQYVLEHFEMDRCFQFIEDTFLLFINKNRENN